MMLTCSWLLAHQGVEVIVVLSNGPTRGARPGRLLSCWINFHLAEGCECLSMVLEPDCVEASPEMNPAFDP